MENQRAVIHEGKAKILFRHHDDKLAVQHFKDTITAFNSVKADYIEGKGATNCQISNILLSHIARHNIATHIVSLVSPREQLVRKLDMVPLEIVVRNVAAGSLCKKFDIAEGQVFPEPLVEFYLKSDRLGDPLITEDHIVCFHIVTKNDLQQIRSMALNINCVLREVFANVGITLVDFKFEVGFSIEDRVIVLGDEISPDTCRLRDSTTNKVLDKDLYRFKLGDVGEGYNEVLRRLEQYAPTH
ncbi:phosphoribosylaminoimidazole-succinocarboxamide synthase [Anaplasma platys]|uniref:Phosphoribosylaminoimidazole-succinocarboxamide synthase n=1 Tax=Anaplasma platys TaxID=949 RepID=A0A858PXE7_9RICK|nr:phosphoribosylaminoimidazolesuccinocarboxamide synthase [Anaplasma platys]QJC27252.1 phosphoribosylaminoimidazole-succinocarboxamide synthase [Anaplasma platys]